MLLHDVADRLNTVADHLPLTDQIRPDPGLSEILDDEVRHLARLLGYLVGESAFRHRATIRYPHQPTATDRRTTLALASAAQPVGAALAVLGAAVHHLGLLTHLTHQPTSPAGDRSIATAHQGLVDRIGDARTHLARAAKQLRAAADTQVTPAVTAPRPPAASSAASRNR
ncbi:hypothetical protein [Streptomyces sp. TRM68367]|uniref:hypothetical protein n=1 Tax=Streptomyces sp. TRM68367 TaxID=2758415 RepID=UPI00165CD5AB|nr:hypothetical protein [Streptomyces sp. TRM68367]MBC9723745.1 hypothetical protein [Streptomyces sp. TRM68367]